MKITEMALETRPRERLQQEGVSVLSSAELLAIVLKSGTKKENVLQIAHNLLAKYGLENLSSCSLQELSQEYGIGNAKACQLIALFELQKRISYKKNESSPIQCSEDIAEIYLPKMSSLRQERFIAVYLDTRNRIICDETLTIGILDASLVHPREVFHGAIRNLARSVVVIHNHPSGDPEPSEEDLEITKNLAKAGKLMGIELLDHLILGKQAWWSWRDSKHNF